jgi:hypothetical protein
MDGFLIFQYDVAKKIYKGNYTIKDQLRKILGKVPKDKFIDEIDNKLNEAYLNGKEIFTGEFAQPFSQIYKNTIIPKLKGLVYRGERDGYCLVAYDPKNIEPLQWSNDDGENWNNIYTKDYADFVYKRKKGTGFKYDLESGLPIDEIIGKYGYDKFAKFLYKLSSAGIADLLRYSKNSDELARMIIDIKGDTLDSDGIEYLLNYSKNPDELAMKIINVKGNTLVSYDIGYLLNYSSNPDELAMKIINVKGNTLDVNDINKLLIRYSNRDELARFIIDVKGDTLDSYGIDILLALSKIPDVLARIIIDVKGNTLDSSDIYTLLKYSKNRDELSRMIINAKGNTLDSSGIDSLLSYSEDRDELIRMIIDLKGNSLDSKSIFYLLLYSNNPNEVKDLLLNSGIIKDDINNTIKKFDINTNLIP